MEVQESLTIVEALADGADPVTGETLDLEDPCQQPQVIRALYVAAAELRNAARRVARDARLPENAGAAWDDEEDRRLGTAYDAGRTVRELASQHKRTQGAIQRRLEKLGKIPAQEPTGVRARSA